LPGVEDAREADEVMDAREAEETPEVAGSTGVEDGATHAGSVHVIVAVEVFVMTEVIGELNTLVRLPDVIV